MNENNGMNNSTAKEKAPNKALLITKKILSTISLVLCLALLVIAAWLCIDKFILKSPVPSFCGYSSLSIATGSMSGTLEIGDIIIIKDTDDYKLGDIVTYLKEGETIPTTHRIINYAEEEGRFITKGDYNNSDDGVEGVAEEDILGEMVLHLPILGMFVGWVKEGGGMIYLIAVVLILAIGAYMLHNEKKMAALVAAQKSADTEADKKSDAPVDEAKADATEEKTEEQTEKKDD